MKIILASESPFRKRAMDMLGIEYETCPSNLDEKTIRDRDPAELTRKLAEAKAWKLANERPDAVIVSGDAVAAKGGTILEKPCDLDEAVRFLRELSGSEFQFVTALVVLDAQAKRMQSTVETSNITFRELTEPEIQAYVSKYNVLSYAGAFESDAVLKFAECISGSYNFVTALSVSRLIVFLRALGVEV
jgi:septum formation protein